MKDNLATFYMMKIHEVFCDNLMVNYLKHSGDQNIEEINLSMLSADAVPDFVSLANLSLISIHPNILFASLLLLKS